jgi:hypothetical protein
MARLSDAEIETLFGTDPQLPFHAVLHTSGTGLWSRAVCAVPCDGIALGYISNDVRHGELRVYFDTSVWDVDAQGLIYTDKLFIAQLRKALAELGLSSEQVDYSEAGMQGRNFVSLDVGAEFLQSWLRLQNAISV